MKVGTTCDLQSAFLNGDCCVIFMKQPKQVCCQVVRRNPWGRPDVAGEQSHFPKKSQRRRGWGYNQTRGRKAWPEKNMALDKSSGQMTVFERQGSRKWRSEWDWYSVRPWADDDGVRQVDCWGRAGVITWQTTHQAELAEGVCVCGGGWWWGQTVMQQQTAERHIGLYRDKGLTIEVQMRL